MSITQWAPVGRRGASDMPLTTSVNHWLTSMTNASPCPFSVDIATTAVFTPENSQPNLFVFDPMTRRMKLIPAAQVTTNLLESHFGTQGGGAAVMHNDLMTPSFDEFAGGAVWAQIAAEAGLRRPSETAADAANKYAHFATFGQGAGGIAINRNIAAAKPPQPPSRHTGRTFDSATAESPAIIFQGPGGQPSAGNNASTKSDGKSEGDCDTPPALSAVPVAHSADTHAISMGTPLPPARFVSVPSAIFFSERPDPSTMPVTMLITAEILSSDDVSVLIRRRFPTPQGVLVSLRSEQSLAMDRYTPIHGMTSPSIRDFVAYAVVPSTGSYVDPASARCQVEEWTGMGRGGGRGTPGGDRSLTASHLPFPPLKLKNNAIPSPGGGAREPSPYLGTVADATRQPLPIAQGTMIAGLASAAAVTIAEALLRREANIGSNSTCALTVWIRSSSSNTSPTYTVIALPCASINGDSLTAFSWMEFANTPAKQQQQQPPPPPPAWSTHMAASTSTAPPGSVKPGAKTGPRPVSASTRRSSPGRKPEGDSPAYTAVTNSPPRRFGAHESRELDLLHSTSQYLASSPRERCCPNCHRLLGEQRQPPAAMSVKMANSEAPSRPTSAKSAVTAPAPVPVPSLGYKVVSVRYVAIAEWMLRQQRRVQKGLEKLIPATIPQLPKKRKDGRTVLPPRPRSARHASDPAAVARLPQTAACFQTTHEWAKMPPVLERLNVPLEDILERAVWAQRTVNLCGECAALFDPEAANAPPASSRGTSPPRHSSPAKAAAVASEKTGTEAAKPPPGLTSDVIDCIALTDLQAQHRETRRVQREKFEMRLVALECADHEARPSTPVREASKVEELLESFAGHDAVITTADAPLSWTLCSELYYAMLRVCALPPEPELGAVVSRPARNTQAGRFPQPEVLVATKFQPDSSTSPNRGGGGVPGADEDDDEAQANAPSLSESLSYRSLARTSHTFAQMRHAERQMVVRFVGGDKNHVAGLVLGTGTHEEDTLA